MILGACLILAGCGKPPTTVVHEFYNAPQDRYFRTANAAEAAALKSDSAAGETDTGKTFLAYPASDYPKDAVPVCRFYGSPTLGPNSHFFTADGGECQKLRDMQQSTPATEKRWNYEGIAFAVRLPAGDKCPDDAPVPVYRAYNDGFKRGKDSNHRLMTEIAVYQSMIAAGWVGEKIVMCTPAA